MNAPRTDAFLSDGTVAFAAARESALCVDAHVSMGTVRVVEASERFADASRGGISAEVAEALADGSVFVVGSALGVGSA